MIRIRIGLQPYRLGHETPFHRVIADIFSRMRVMFCIKDPYFGEAFLPERRSYSKFFAGAKRKSSLDELDRAFNGHVASDSEQQMKVVGHDHKFMQHEFSLRAVFVEGFKEEFCGAILIATSFVFPMLMRSRRKCGHEKGCWLGLHDEQELPLAQYPRWMWRCM
jgi:hypothetical protein